MPLLVIFFELLVNFQLPPLGLVIPYLKCKNFPLCTNSSWLTGSGADCGYGHDYGPATDGDDSAPPFRALNRTEPRTKPKGGWKVEWTGGVDSNCFGGSGWEGVCLPDGMQGGEGTLEVREVPRHRSRRSVSRQLLASRHLMTSVFITKCIKMLYRWFFCGRGRGGLVCWAVLAIGVGVSAWVELRVLMSLLNAVDGSRRRQMMNKKPNKDRGWWDMR